MQNQLTTIQSAMSRLDEMASRTELIAADSQPFSQAITMASAIEDIRATLTDEVMQKAIMPLMNSKLGFRTDRDPARPVWNRKTNRMEAPTAYPVATVRECLIEATLRGVPPVGNCWNIIAGQSYITKEGFWFLVGRKIPGLTDFKVQVGVPRMVKAAGDARNASDEEAKGAIVHCSATWKLHGVPDRVDREIPIRVNAMMGADAIMGKAERKILAAAYAQITGTTLGDADATEVENPTADLRNVTPKVTIDQPIDPFDKAEPPAAEAPAKGRGRGKTATVDAPATQPETAIQEPLL